MRAERWGDAQRSWRPDLTRNQRAGKVKSDLTLRAFSFTNEETEAL